MHRFIFILSLTWGCLCTSRASEAGQCVPGSGGTCRPPDSQVLLQGKMFVDQDVAQAEGNEYFAMPTGSIAQRGQGCKWSEAITSMEDCLAASDSIVKTKPGLAITRTNNAKRAGNWAYLPGGCVIVKDISYGSWKQKGTQLLFNKIPGKARRGVTPLCVRNEADVCKTSSWPNRKVTCSKCKAMVSVEDNRGWDGNCKDYCQARGLFCKAAYDNQDQQTCAVISEGTCDDLKSVTICECEPQATCDQFACGTKDSVTYPNKGSSVKCPGGLATCSFLKCCEAPPKTTLECLAEKKCFAEIKGERSDAEVAAFAQKCLVCPPNQVPDPECQEYKMCITRAKGMLTDKSFRLLDNLDIVQGYIKREATMATSGLQLAARAQAADSTEQPPCRDPSSVQEIRKVRDNCPCIQELHDLCDGKPDQQACLRNEACRSPVVCSSWKRAETFGVPNCPGLLIENTSSATVLERTDSLEESMTFKKIC